MNAGTKTSTHEIRSEVLGISASPRPRGNSDWILKTVLKEINAAGPATEVVSLRDYWFQPCIGCERCRKDRACTGLNDGMQLLYPKVVESRGLVLVSPTHNYNVTAWMKAFIDRLYCFYKFEDTHPRAWSSYLAGQGRKAVVAAVCEQTDPSDMGFTLEAMRRPLSALGYDIVAEVAVFGHFERGAVKHDPEAVGQCRDAGRRLAHAMLNEA